MGGRNSLQGRVEVYFNDEWGTVCDDSWDINDARVVCRQLGFGPPTSAPDSAYFGLGTGGIFLDNVQCDGSEPSLSSCTHNGVGVHNCGHGEDASVKCAGGEQERVSIDKYTRKRQSKAPEVIRSGPFPEGVTVPSSDWRGVYICFTSVID